MIHRPIRIIRKVLQLRMFIFRMTQSFRQLLLFAQERIQKGIVFRGVIFLRWRVFRFQSSVRGVRCGRSAVNDPAASAVITKHATEIRIFHELIYPSLPLGRCWS